LERLLCHEKLSVRFLMLFLLGTIVFMLAWILSYYLLPEGVLRGRTGSAVLAGDSAARTFVAEWARIMAVNLAVGSLIVLANRILRFRGFPLGYLIPLIWLVQYGVLLGTNSFSIPLPGRMQPSLAVFRRAGPYEMTAYILAAAATYSLSLYRGERLFPPQSEPILPKPEFSLTRADYIGMCLAVLVLIAADAWEAQMIVSG
jgi:hypothetical protein